MHNLATHGVDHYENFPVASWLTPARLRPAVLAIYRFARTADDLADEGQASCAQRLTELAAFREALYNCLNSDAPPQRWPAVFKPLGHAICHHALPLAPFDALLQAFEQDVRHSANAHWYATHEELLDYCRKSANPIGRLLLHLYGIHGEREHSASDAICTALQLINFWQDPSQDIPRARYYFPLEALAAHQLQKHDIECASDSERSMRLIASCAHAARAQMQRGFALPHALRQQCPGFDGWRLSLELRCVIHGGLRILEKIAALQYRTLSARPKLTKWDAVLIFWRAIWHPA